MAIDLFCRDIADLRGCGKILAAWDQANAVPPGAKHVYVHDGAAAKQVTDHGLSNDLGATPRVMGNIFHPSQLSLGGKSAVCLPDAVHTFEYSSLCDFWLRRI